MSTIYKYGRGGDDNKAGCQRLTLRALRQPALALCTRMSLSVRLFSAAVDASSSSTAAARLLLPPKRQGGA